MYLRFLNSTQSALTRPATDIPSTKMQACLVAILKSPLANPIQYAIILFLLFLFSFFQHSSFRRGASNV